MTLPFVSQLRSRAQPIRLAGVGGPAISVRVEVPEVWDVVLVETPAAEAALAVKVAALSALMPGADQRDYVLKLRGSEVLDESRSLTDVGAIDGSIFLLTGRRRRPVR